MAVVAVTCSAAVTVTVTETVCTTALRRLDFSGLAMLEGRMELPGAPPDLSHKPDEGLKAGMAEPLMGKERHPTKGLRVPVRGYDRAQTRERAPSDYV